MDFQSDSAGEIQENGPAEAGEDIGQNLHHVCLVEHQDQECCV